MIEDVQDLQAFGQNFCNVRWDGDNVTVACEVVDPSSGQPVHYERTIQLGPIVEWLHKRFCQFHERAHGCKPDTAQVSGLGSQFVKTARNLAASKGVRQLAVDAAPILFPGSVITWELANEASKTVVKAKAGDPAAKEKVVAVKELANAGDPKAKEVAKVMANTATIINAKDANPTPRPTSIYKRGLYVGLDNESNWLDIVGHDAVELGARVPRSTRHAEPAARSRGSYGSAAGRYGTVTQRQANRGDVKRQTRQDNAVMRSSVVQQNNAMNTQMAEQMRQQALQQQMQVQQMQQQSAMMQAMNEQMASDPYGGMGGGYGADPYGSMGMDPYSYGMNGAPMDPYGASSYGIDPYAYGADGAYGGMDPTMPQCTGSQVYDPNTESFSSSTVKSYYDPNTESFQNYTNQ